MTRPTYSRLCCLAIGLLAGAVALVTTGCKDASSSIEPESPAVASTKDPPSATQPTVPPSIQPAVPPTTPPTTPPSMPPTVDPPRSNGGTKPPVTPRPGDNVKPAVQPPAVPPEEMAAITMPKIKLSEAHAATCLVKQGELLPAATLTDLENQPRQLADLLGERLTLVFFWTAENLYSLAVLEDMGPDVLSPFAQRGVRVVGINRGDPADVVKQHVEKAAAAYPNLLDADSAYFGQVATAGIPRLYLVDAEGKILWFDIEYGKETRQDIQNAIRYSLGDR